MNNCLVCRIGVMRDERVETWIPKGERWVLFTQVPASRCDACGETTYSAQITERLAAVLAPESMEVPTGARWVPEFNLEVLDSYVTAGSKPLVISGTAGLNLETSVVENRVASEPAIPA